MHFLAVLAFVAATSLRAQPAGHGAGLALDAYLAGHTYRTHRVFT